MRGSQEKRVQLKSCGGRKLSQCCTSRKVFSRKRDEPLRSWLSPGGDHEWTCRPQENRKWGLSNRPQPSLIPQGWVIQIEHKYKPGQPEVQSALSCREFEFASS